MLAIQKFIDEALRHKHKADVGMNLPSYDFDAHKNDLNKSLLCLMALLGTINTLKDIGNNGTPQEFDSWLTSHDLIAKICEDALQQCERIINNNQKETK